MPSFLVRKMLSFETMNFLESLHFLNSPDTIYGAILVLLLVIFVFYNFCLRAFICLFASQLLSSRVRPFILNHIVYARSYWHFLGIGPTSRSHLMLAIIYFIGTGICNIINVHTAEDAWKRAAKLSIINLIPMFLGAGYEFAACLLGVSLRTYGFLHRSFALVAFIEALIHVIIVARSMEISWSTDNQFYGLLTASFFLALTLLPLVRKRVYEVFFITHFGCAVTMIFTIWKHTRSSDGVIWIFPLIYTVTLITSGILRLARIIYRNVAIGRSYARLNMQTHIGDTARITISLPRPWEVRAGQRISLGVPSVGIFCIFQSHPFTITWWEKDKRGRAVSISILVRPRSGFTRKLFDRIEPNMECGAWIDGPFGPSSVGLGFHGRVGDYGHIFMIATGIGIAALLPYIKELLDGRDMAQVRTQRISLIWQLDRIGDYESARDLLQILVKQDNGYMLCVSIYDPVHAPSAGEVQDIGENGLIHVHSGGANWEEQLNSELEHQRGKLLVLVSAQVNTRYNIRNLVRRHLDHDIEIFEPEFQPWGQTGSLRSFLRP